ncbi:phage terminase small subunit P27 family [Lysinibacillus sp. NPDC096418]|uniref:phage terminase small subunit P27 family n=1 Tax=Lysinibacillus sp. NPDC096418 TaxID=3364138 RepID=UPI00380C919A
MAGRNKQPLQVIQGKGRSNHLTKDEVNKRQKHEEKMRGPTENIVAPSYLTAAQKKEFTELAEKLVALEIFSELDVDSLARYLDSKHQYLQLVKDMRKMKPTEIIEHPNGKKVTIANENYPKLARVKNTLFNECRSAAADLGLTITSRLKLVIPTPSTVEGRSDAQKRFGDRL